MKKLLNTYGVILAAALVFVGIPSIAAADLGEILRESGCDWIIGHWEDAGTESEKNKVSFSWRFEGKVVELVLREKEGENVSLMGYNPKTEEVFHVSADNQGGSSVGKWTFENRTAVLDLSFVTSDKQEGSMRIRHEYKDDNTMTVTIDLEKPIVFEMVRVKNPDAS